MVQHVPSSDDVRLYEIAILYPYPLNQKDEAQLHKAIDEVLAEANATIVFSEVWGRRGLAYGIGGFNEGNFRIVYVELAPAAVKELDTQLGLLRGVLRHLIVKPPKHYEIVPFANNLEQWKERSRVEEQVAAQEREDRLKKQVLEKARRSQTQTRERAKPTDAAAPKKDLTQELDKLISDSDLEI